MGGSAKARAARAAAAALHGHHHHHHHQHQHQGLMPTHVKTAVVSAESAAAMTSTSSMAATTVATTTTSKLGGWLVVVHKSARGVVSAFAAAARVAGVAFVVIGGLVWLGWLALQTFDRVQLWMTAAGVAMLALSVASAFQEVAKGHAVRAAVDSKPSTRGADANEDGQPQDGDQEDDAKMITIPTVVDKSSDRVVPSVMAMTSSHVEMAMPSPSPSSTPPHQQQQQHYSQQEDKATATTTAAMGQAMRRNSSTLEMGGNTLTTVRHCGTVIDLQGPRGLLIPHHLDSDTVTSCTRTHHQRLQQQQQQQQKQRTVSRNRSHRQANAMPLVLPFVLRHVVAEIAVGMTVEFAFAADEAVTTTNSYSTATNTNANNANNANANKTTNTNNNGTNNSHSVTSRGSPLARSRHRPATGVAIDVTPVASDEEIAKSRHALQSCKQAREQSFARAMGELTTLSPRHEPLKHPVDLIQYAAHLDDVDWPLDQFI